MDILIKNMELPKNYPYRLTIEADGTVMEHCFGYKAKAIEIPPHGELIERDKILEYIEDHETLNIGTLYDVIQDAPTVLEANND